MHVGVLHKTFSILLSLLVMGSTLSFTIESHYCGGHLVDTAIFSEAKKCGGMDVEKTVYNKKPCCKDTIEVVQGQDDLNTADVQKLDKSIEYTAIAYVCAYLNLFESLPKLIIPHKDYSPPNIVEDIYILDESFLI